MFKLITWAISFHCLNVSTLSTFDVDTIYELLYTVVSFLNQIMDYDEILDELGHFSRWHLLHISLLWLFAVTGAFATLSYTFTGI